VPPHDDLSSADNRDKESHLTGRADADSRARTHLANERTFLAWFRTGVTLIALGLAAEGLLGSRSAPELVSLLAATVAAAGIVLLIVGRARYAKSRRLIDAGNYLPASISVDISVAIFVAAGVLAIALIALGLLS
jgi:putative membrane protein